MTQERVVTYADFLTNAAARDAGFSGQFWLDAYKRFEDKVEADPSRSFDKWEVARTVRVPFEQGHFDVLVRVQPEPREYGILRFTVFPASDEPQPRPIDPDYWYGDDAKEDRPVLAEAALLDYINRW